MRFGRCRIHSEEAYVQWNKCDIGSITDVIPKKWAAQRGFDLCHNLRFVQTDTSEGPGMINPAGTLAA
jgi:hypothetical protein